MPSNRNQAMLGAFGCRHSGTCLPLVNPRETSCGKTAASRMTPKQRSERARKAALASAKARQAKAKAKGGQQ